MCTTTQEQVIGQVNALEIPLNPLPQLMNIFLTHFSNTEIIAKINHSAITSRKIANPYNRICKEMTTKLYK